MRTSTAVKIAIGLGVVVWTARRSDAVNLVRRSVPGLMDKVSSDQVVKSTPEVVLKGIQGTYGRYARWYDASMSAMALGQERVLRREAVARLRPAVGETVLDVACGTGANFPYLQEAIGPTGRIIGIDLTEGMLEQARERVRREGWQNVTLVQGEAARLELTEPVDAVLCTLAIGLIPERKQALRRMVETLKPGGRILIADAKLVEGRFAFVANALMKAVGRPWLPSSSSDAYWAARPWEDLRELVGEIEYGELFGGAIYYAVGARTTQLSTNETS